MEERLDKRLMHRVDGEMDARGRTLAVDPPTTPPKCVSDGKYVMTILIGDAE